MIMKHFIIIFVILLGTAFAGWIGHKQNKSVLEKIHEYSLSSRIVNGKTAENGSFPYQVSLRIDKKHTCGGAIINEFWILTAAHCVPDPKWNFLKIYAGTNKLDTGGEVYDVIYSLMHPYYSRYTADNDIGLLKVNKAIKFSEFVQPIPLASSDVIDYEDAVFSGWGRLTPNGETPNDLQYLDVFVLNPDTCSYVVPIYLQKTIVCAFGKYNQGVCHGDSGGPLVVRGALVGVASRLVELPCANSFPDLYTYVYKYLDWINEVIESKNSQ